VRRSRTEARVDCGLQGLERHPPRASSSSNKGKLGSSHYNGEFTKDFLKWVLDKEKEGFVFWLKPDKDLEKLSEFFEEKTDTVNEVPYKPLLLDPQWWRVRFLRTSARYVSNPSLVVAGIAGQAGDQGGDIDMRVLQELIYQSNPNLEPIAKWPHAPSMRFLPRPAALADDVSGEGKYKGYIDQEKALESSLLSSSVRENSRISRWPERPRDRLDNLQQLWQAEEASHSRRQVFAMTGLSTMGGALTAR